MNQLDYFYPVSESILGCTDGMWQIAMSLKLSDHRQKAMAGDREAESRLINRLGQLRRCCHDLGSLSEPLQAEVRASAAWLRSVGRKVNFHNSNPAMWVSARDGKSPRW